jgi:hypothetical protein
MLKPWDPEISEFSVGRGIQDSGSGDTGQQFFVVPAIYPLEFSKICLPFPLSKISGVKLFATVLSSRLELEAVAIEPPAFIVTSSNSTDETIVVDYDVEMETASSALTIVVAEDGLSLADVTPEAKHSSDLAAISEFIKLSCDAFYYDVIHSLMGVHSTDNCQLHAKWIVQSVDSTLSSVGVFPSRDIDSFNYELDKSEKFITAWAAAALDGEMGTVTAAWGQATLQGGGNVSTYGPCGSSGPWASLCSGSRVDKRCSKQRGEDIEQHSTKQNSYGLFLFLWLSPSSHPWLFFSFPKFLFQIHVIRYS